MGDKKLKLWITFLQSKTIVILFGLRPGKGAVRIGLKRPRIRPFVVARRKASDRQCSAIPQGLLTNGRYSSVLLA